jgi:phospholipase C
MAQRVREFLIGLETVLLTLLLMSSDAATASQPATRPTDVPIEHLIVFYQENHTFDNLYGEFPGANGLDKPGARIQQVNEEGKPYRTLPQPLKHGRPDKRFPDDLPNAPFLINPYVSADKLTGDPIHGFYQYKLQMNKGKMNKNVAWTDQGGLSMGHYETKNSHSTPTPGPTRSPTTTSQGRSGSPCSTTSGCSVLARRSGRTPLRTWWHTRSSMRRAT